jgi:hypothetical protein
LISYARPKKYFQKIRRFPKTRPFLSPPGLKYRGTCFLAPLSTVPFLWQRCPKRAYAKIGTFWDILGHETATAQQKRRRAG